MRLCLIFSNLVALLSLSSISGAVYAQDGAGSPCVGSRAPQGMTSLTLEFGGLTREYLLYIPESYAVARVITQPVPLVLSLHGFASSPEQQMLWSQWDELADSQNFIVVYPQGTGSPLRWNSGQTEIEGMRPPSGQGPFAEMLSHFFESVPVDDVAFIRGLIIELQAFYCIDPMRIYVTGLSNGGGMSNRLACELSDRIAAIGTVAGAYTEFPGGCHPSRPVPVIAFHGAADPIVPYQGDEQIHFPAIETWAADWAARDSCDPTPQVIEGLVGAVSGIRYINCVGNAEVDLYTIADGGHSWPGGFPIPALLVGKTSDDIDASATMWEFFQAHPLV